MIRINLLAGDHGRVGRRAGLDLPQKVTLACSLIMLATALGIGWWYWSMRQAGARLDQEIAAARQETERLGSVLEQVEQYEGRRAQLQQRVALIEQLRHGQGEPVRMLDEVSRALPDGLWLTELRQAGPDVTIQGRATALTAVSDFVGKLERSGYFARPVEILESQMEQLPQGEVVDFSIKARFSPPDVVSARIGDNRRISSEAPGR